MYIRTVDWYIVYFLSESNYCVNYYEIYYSELLLLITRSIIGSSYDNDIYKRRSAERQYYYTK